MYLRLWRHHQINMRAAALTYTLILSLVPLLAVCLSVFSLFVDIKRLSLEFKTFLFKHLAAGAGVMVDKQIDTFLAKVKFKTLGYVGFFALLLISLLLLNAVEDSINRIWSIQKKKKLWKRILTYNLLLFLGPVSVSLSLATTTIVMKYFPHLAVKANLGAVFISAILLTLTYKIFPNKKVWWSAALISGILAAVSLEVAKWAYTSYSAKILFYNKVYGSLAVLPFFLIWIYLNWLLFLGGALLTYMLQHYKTLNVRGKSS